MKTAAIIAEYNPCHNGHIYHINTTKKLTGAQCVIAVMSGNFTQRGTPAFADKFTRTGHALNCGVDLVIELPCIYATASAELFAAGAISTLSYLPDIEFLSFGCENHNLNHLTKIAGILANESEDFSILLKKYLKQGYSFPKARGLALNDYCKDISVNETISSPNNILAIEYIKALIKNGLTIQPVPIKRAGNNYHDTDTLNPLTSASAVRNAFLNGHYDSTKRLLNKYVYDDIISLNNTVLPIAPDDASVLINYALQCNINNLTDYFDVSQSLANKIKKTYEKSSFYTLEALCDILKSKELNHSRISRAICHVLLNIRSDFMTGIIADNCPSYVRILGFNSTGREYLNSIKDMDSLPILSGCQNASKKLSPMQYNVFLKDVFATNVYNNLVMSKFKTALPDDYRSRPIIL